MRLESRKRSLANYKATHKEQVHQQNSEHYQANRQAILSKQAEKDATKKDAQKDATVFNNGYLLVRQFPK